MADKYFYAVGRRKESSARVKLFPNGKGSITVNDKPILEYFGNERLSKRAQESLKILSLDGKFDVSVKVIGGGKNGQAEAIRHGIARALVIGDETRKPTLRKAGYITRDPRAKERKKYGLKGARKAPQFSKR